ncbi:MAG: dihydrodipicolinate synthase family protein [SAR202 cluster bacterium]|nr:dihydrodipicolinate synthase family protein [SAR202 cluster bacterium]
MTARQDKLVGIAVSLPTFTNSDHEIQLNKTKFHVNWLIEQGIKEGNAVLFVGGGLGEGYFLDDDEWKATADALVEAAAGRVPTGIGVFDLSARMAARKARWARDIGIDFIQTAAPHYMAPTEQEVFDHFRYVNDAADIGIMAYNIPWAMPNGFEYSRGLIEKFTTLERFVGLKWSSKTSQHFIDMLRLYSDKLSFIINGGIMSVGYRLGGRGFTDFNVNCAPRLSLHRWGLVQQKRFDELDALDLKMRTDAALANPGAFASPGMGEGPAARLRLRALGMETGPHFPAQAPLPQSVVDAYTEFTKASGILEWVDWKDSNFDQMETERPTASSSGYF